MTHEWATDGCAMHNLILVSGQEVVLAPVEIENLWKRIATDSEYGGKIQHVVCWVSSYWI